MNKEKKQNSYSIIIMFLFMVLLNYTTSAKTYTGKIEPILTSNIRAGADTDYWGSLAYAEHIGQLIEPKITDLKGNIVTKGTTIVSLRKKYFVGQVIAAKGMLIAAQKSLEVADENYKRYKKLYPTEAISIKEFQDVRMAYYDAVGAYKRAQAFLDEQERYLVKCQHISPIEGIVDKVFYARGLLVGNPEVIEVSQLNPIGIKIKMPLNEANLINASTPISVYIDGKEKPIGVYNGVTMPCKEGIILVASNYQVPNTDKNIPYFRDCFHVEKFFICDSSKKDLAVPIPALHKDDKGYYVWKGKDRKFMQPGKGLDPVFQVQKVYVVPGNLKRLYNAITYMRVLKDPGNLELYDLVIASPIDHTLKDGDTVSFPPERYEMMPGDKVKVIIGKKKL